MNNEFEELYLPEDEDLESIHKSKVVTRLGVPCLSVGPCHIHFNRLAKEIIPDYVLWYITSSYVIGLPAHRRSANAYKVREHNGGLSTKFPAELKSKMVTKGLYKVYKYKNGFAFKRYEPLLVRE